MMSLYTDVLKVGGDTVYKQGKADKDATVGERLAIGAGTQFIHKPMCEIRKIYLCSSSIKIQQPIIMNV